jgi:putative transposase
MPMPRPTRLNVADAYFHVTCNGAVKQTIFARDDDRLIFLRMLARTIERHRWHCHSYCLMGTHYHLIVETTEPTLSQGMHQLNLGYARWFNRQNGGRGHVFEARFYSGLIETETHLLGTIRYIAHNPVHAGLCAHPEDWPWSSYRVLLGAEAPVAGIIDARRTLALVYSRDLYEDRLRELVEAA